MVWMWHRAPKDFLCRHQYGGQSLPVLKLIKIDCCASKKRLRRKDGMKITFMGGVQENTIFNN